MGRYWSQGTKLQVCRMSKSRHLKFSMLAVINNTVLYFAKKVDFRCSHQKINEMMFISLTVVTISTCLSDQHAVTFKYI